MTLFRVYASQRGIVFVPASRRYNSAIQLPTYRTGCLKKSVTSKY